jgi:DNA (cytosine-5)-methyltransferase 1
VSRPLLLDLFCGAGGAAMGYHRAGFDVVGVDLEPQPHYPFTFIRGDAMAPPVNLRAFDAIHASPPCQGYSHMSSRWGSDSPLLIDPVRDLLAASGLPWVIENVTGAAKAMRSPVLLDGSMFDLGVQRRRLFESNMLLAQPRRPRPMRSECGVYGQRPDGRLLWTRTDGTEYRAAASLEQAQRVMGMDWGDWHGVKEAIPPAYTEWIGSQILTQLEVAA